MTRFASDSGLRSAARITFSASMLLFVVTIVIGILNGIDVWEPNHDSLIGHVHAGTLGWITLGVSGIGFLMFSKGRDVSADEAKRADTLAWAMAISITLYAGAFFLGDAVFSDRIQRPIVGTVLFVVVIWYFTWLLKAHRSYGETTPYRLGFVLGWISLMIGAVLGVILGLFIGKPLGITLACFIAVKLGLGTLSKGVTWRHMIGAGCLATLHDVGPYRTAQPELESADRLPAIYDPFKLELRRI